MSGGLVAERQSADGEWQAVNQGKELSQPVPCAIDGVPCAAQEARFGGVVIQTSR
ncbi:MAG: hypothetical protein HQ526_00880 [Actinobacteria bacterium]|nr:hypothetical protein [Actinomycetota bacterium]